MLEHVAAGWRSGASRAAAECFSEDAVYIEPPDRQRYRGSDELFEFFGGDDPPKMDMRWHHIFFDEARQVGTGEYTFRGTRQYHGVVLAHCRDGRISHWREYQYASDLDWRRFVGESEPDVAETIGPRSTLEQSSASSDA